MKKILPVLLLLSIGMTEIVPAQNVFSPLDVNYSFPSPEPPAPPANTLAKWYRSEMGTWNTDKFKSYYWNGMAFRLRFPNNYNPDDPAAKYPLILSLHGGGEVGLDNDHQLQVGAQFFEQVIDQGHFNGFLLLPQLTQVTGWDRSYFDRINSVIDSLEKYCRADPDRVITTGLSNGGFSALAHAIYYPTRTATVIGSSPALLQNYTDQDHFQGLHVPVWLGSGGHDVNPTPQEVDGFVNSFRAKGGDIRYSFFPNLGHVMWNEQWAEPYLAPYLNNAHKANPLVYFQRTHFPNEASVNARLGVSAGFAQYQWQRNGVDIPGATSNEYTATSSGTYRVHFKRSISGEWSAWSPRPVVITVDGGPSGNGLRYSYYEGEYYSLPDFNSLTPIKTGTTENFDIGVKDRNDLFAIRWDGNITITTPGTYTFETVSDDGSKLYVNQPYSHTGVALVNNDNPHSPTSVSATIDLPAGTYPITATFFENVGGELMQVYYSGPGIERQLIPNSVLTLPSTNVATNTLNYRFYQGTWDALPNFDALVPAKTGSSANIDLGVRTAGVDDNFAFVWEGYFNAQVPGNYTFELISDDGSMMYLGTHYSPTAVPFIDNNYLHAAVSVSRTTTLTAGLHPVCFTFFEATGNELMQVYVSGPGIPRQLIPNAAFVRASAAPSALNGVQTAGVSNQQASVATAIAGNRNLNEDAGNKLRTNAFPNPFRDNLNIQYYNAVAGTKVSVDICDLAGRVLFNRKYDNLPAGTSTLGLSSVTHQLRPGMYTLRLNVNGVPNKVWKVVKAKD
jgi:predicted esterase